MTIQFSVGKCKTRAAHSAKPKSRVKLNLEKIKKHFHVTVETPILLMLNINNIEIIVHSYGEILFKSGDDFDFMEETARKIYEAGEEK